MSVKSHFSQKNESFLQSSVPNQYKVLILCNPEGITPAIKQEVNTNSQQKRSGKQISYETVSPDGTYTTHGALIFPGEDGVVHQWESEHSHHFDELWIPPCRDGYYFIYNIFHWKDGSLDHARLCEEATILLGFIKPGGKLYISVPEMYNLEEAKSVLTTCSMKSNTEIVQLDSSFRYIKLTSTHT